MKTKRITDESGVTHYFDGDEHRGWAIGYNPDAPATGRWCAMRHGVAMCAGTREALVRMVDQRIADDAAWRSARA